MKVLDPQSALLTNAEVYQFLRANPPRTADRQVGAYPTVSLAGYGTVRKDVSPGWCIVIMPPCSAKSVLVI